jgi:hypothetical protein
MQILRYVLPIAGLAYVFYHIHFEKLIQDMKNLSWLWACAAVAVNSTSYFCQSLRWLWFLPPRIPFSTVQAVKIEKTVAAGFSIVVYFLMRAPLWAAGFLVISREGMSISQIEKEVGALRSKLGDRKKG